jgi:transcriptional activator of cad operon
MDESRDILRIGAWQARRSSGELLGPDGAARLEPKVAELLFLLGARPNEVVTREEIMESLWPDVVVGEDTLARLVFKLRRALGDDPKAPRFVETLPKRGYRLRLDAPAEESAAAAPAAAAPAPAPGPRRKHLWLAGLVPMALAIWAVFAWRSAPAPAAPPTLPAEIAARATDFYFQYSREDNEAAIELFERLVGSHPEYAPAYSGLANALVQRVMRWPSEPPGVTHRTLRTALEDGHMRLPSARRTLERAEALARQAVALAPADAEAHKALGLVRSTQGDFAGARAAYRRAIELDADAWGAMINMGDVLEIEGRGPEALPFFEAAFAAMTRVYSRQVPRVQPWYAELATGIGDRHLAAGRRSEAESWFRRALEFTPLHPAATRGLAKVLREAGDVQAADRLCGELRERLGAGVDCG